MGFTEWLESLKPMSNVVEILAGIGFTTILLTYLRRFTERRSWHHFKAAVIKWVGDLKEAGHQASDLSDEQWRASCERILTDSGFTPRDIAELLEVSVIVAKGIAADMFF